tara:strand:+ start:139 stop:618 length:480 start_codon:yes stop_codon:yes gene_type:complete
METIAEFNDNQGLNVKLTKDKIYITAAGNEETFALRGVNGVGLYDDLEKYAKEEEEFKGSGKKTKKIKYGLIAIGVLAILSGLTQGGEEAGSSIAVGGALIGGSFLVKNKAKQPVLDSYFKLMLGGADRQFKFIKSDASSGKIADFINKVEDTLTAYSK